MSKSNAVIFFHTDAFDTGIKLMGRQSAGESFLRGFIRHADVDRIYFWNWGAEPLDRLNQLIQKIQPTDKPITWLGRSELPRLAEVGCLFVSSPANSAEAWNRRVLGATRYSVCGLTHTTSSSGAMDSIVALLTSPVEPWDTLICTSEAVQRSVETQMGLAMEFLKERFGPLPAPPIKLETIPLGVNTEDFRRSDEHRRYWRDRLGIADDAIAVLYVGRFSPHGKANPVPMAMALERAAKRTKREVHLVMSGWANNSYLHESFTGSPRRFAPSVKTHVLDGRLEEVRFPIWSAGDLFYSLSDNLQETFGLTPVEAMAAGLPCVISDWNGYRDTVRHGVDGFRIPTLSPRPGLAGDLAIQYANSWETYDHYMGRASQFTLVDLDAAAEALLTLIDNDDLRRRMGAAAAERARSVFDWRTVIGQYQALWGELAAIRRAAPQKGPMGLNPWRPDPFTLFAAYPTRALGPADLVSLAPGATVEAAERILEDPTVAYSSPALPHRPEIAAMVAMLELNGPLPVAEAIRALPPHRQAVAERGFLWLAKHGIAKVTPNPQLTPE